MPWRPDLNLEDATYIFKRFPVIDGFQSANLMGGLAAERPSPTGRGSFPTDVLHPEGQDMMFADLIRKSPALCSMLRRRHWGVPAMGQVTVLAALVVGQVVAATPPPRLTIVLIGGDKQGYPQYEHDYPDGILAIERLIKGSPQLQALDPVIKAFPAGFPSDLSQIADADVVVLYFGVDYRPPRMTNPLENPARLAAMEQLMAKGAGLIALHQASTVADQTSPVPFADWLGAIRFGMADRTTEIAPIEVSGGTNPVANGLKAFDYLDEFYPTMTFSKTTKVTPILTAKVHIQTRNNKPVFEEPAADHIVAWAAERPNGGRSFGFTGVHYLATFDQPEIRTILLNAICGRPSATYRPGERRRTPSPCATTAAGPARPRTHTSVCFCRGRRHWWSRSPGASSNGSLRGRLETPAR